MTPRLQRMEAGSWACLIGCGQAIRSLTSAYANTTPISLYACSTPLLKYNIGYLIAINLQLSTTTNTVIITEQCNTSETMILRSAAKRSRPCCLISEITIYEYRSILIARSMPGAAKSANRHICDCGNRMQYSFVTGSNRRPYIQINNKAR